MKEQRILEAGNHYEQLNEYLKNTGQNKILLVCGSSIRYFEIGRYFDTLEDRLGIKVIRFSNFSPNPVYESVVEGVHLLNEECIKIIVAVGGGSAIDVAKCIKLYSNMNHSQNYFHQKIVANDIDFIAVPTTAGTGSEATKYAVIYDNGEKQSVSDESCIPSAVIFDSTVLKSLPEYQKKATMFDALCHAIESYWSVNSTEESQKYSDLAIRMIISNQDAYLCNSDDGNEKMLMAANIAGKAINITQTTAGHAMCYKLTSLYHIPHGHAAALCVSKLFTYMIKNTDQCVDLRGEAHLKKVFEKIAKAMGCESAEEACEKFDDLLKHFNLVGPVGREEDYLVLRNSVNSDRLKNNPVGLTVEVIDELYRQIVAQSLQVLEGHGDSYES